MRDKNVALYLHQPYKQKQNDFSCCLSSEHESSEEEEDEEEKEGEEKPEVLSPEELEKLKEEVDERKKLISTLRGKPWPMRKKLLTLRC